MNVRCILGRHQWDELRRYVSEQSCRQGRSCLQCGSFSIMPSEQHVWGTWKYAAPDSCQGWLICKRCGREGGPPQGPRHQWTTEEYGSVEAGDIVQSCRRCQTSQSQAAWSYARELPPLDAMALYASLVDRLPGDRPEWREELGARLTAILEGKHVFQPTHQTLPSHTPLEWSTINKENFRLEERARILAAGLLGTMCYRKAQANLLRLYLYNLCSPHEVAYEEPEEFGRSLLGGLQQLGITLPGEVVQSARQIRSGNAQDALAMTSGLALHPSGPVVDLLLMIARDQFRMAQEAFEDEGPLRGTAIGALEELLQHHPSTFSDEQLRTIKAFPATVTVDFPLGGVDGLLHDAYELDFSAIVAAADAVLVQRG